MKNLFIALNFLLLVQASLTSANEIQECRAAWKKLLPYVTRPLNNNDTYLKIAATENQAKFLEERAGTNNKKLSPTNWDFGWVVNIDERAFLVEQQKIAQQRVLQALAGKNTIENIKTLSTLLRSTSSNLQAIGLYALAAIGNPAAAEALMDYEKESNDILVPGVLSSLDYSQSPEVFEKVETYLFKNIVGRNGIDMYIALAKLKSPLVLPLLRRIMLSNQDSWNSLRAYMEMKNKAAIPVFMEVVENANNEQQVAHAILGITYYKMLGLLEDERAQMMAFTKSANNYIDYFDGLNGEPLINLVNLAPNDCKTMQETK